MIELSDCEAELAAAFPGAHVQPGDPKRLGGHPDDLVSEAWYENGVLAGRVVYTESVVAADRRRLVDEFRERGLPLLRAGRSRTIQVQPGPGNTLDFVLIRG